MRILVFFDLPNITPDEKRQYRRFRKNLINNGFMMLQESVYCRMVLNASIERSVIEAIRRFKPQDGLVQILTVTEKQFSKMEFIVGENTNDVIDSEERLIII